jgi:predicted porin
LHLIVHAIQLYKFVVELYFFLRVDIMMKRSIATAVAVATLSAGVANAAEDFEIGVTGFLHSAISASDVENNANEKDLFSILSDNLISFQGATVLDNGLKATAVASFSFTRNDGGANNTQNDFYKEELYVGLGGSFGQVDLGRRRNAASLMHTFIPSAGVGVFGVDDARISAFVGGNNNMTTAASLGDNSVRTEYANRIQYFTPRVEGLQLAASYTPDTNPNDTNTNVTNARYQSPMWYKNEYSLAASYARQFGDYGVKSSVGYTNGQSNGDATSNPGTFNRDSEALQAGMTVSGHGFTVGGAYGQLESGRFASGKDRRLGGGVRYDTGPWGFGVSYLNRYATGSTTIELANGQNVRQVHLWEAGTTYDLGPGVTTGVAAYYNDNVHMDKSFGNGAPEDSVTGVINLSVNF